MQQKNEPIFKVKTLIKFDVSNLDVDWGNLFRSYEN